MSLSEGAVAGIVVGSAASFFLICGTIYVCYRRLTFRPYGDYEDDESTLPLPNMPASGPRVANVPDLSNALIYHEKEGKGGKGQKGKGTMKGKGDLVEDLVPSKNYAGPPPGMEHLCHVEWDNEDGEGGTPGDLGKGVEMMPSEFSRPKDKKIMQWLSDVHPANREGTSNDEAGPSSRHYPDMSTITNLSAATLTIGRSDGDSLSDEDETGEDYTSLRLPYLAPAAMTEQYFGPGGMYGPPQVQVNNASSTAATLPLPYNVLAQPALEQEEPHEDLISKRVPRSVTANDPLQPGRQGGNGNGFVAHGAAAANNSLAQSTLGSKDIGWIAETVATGNSSPAQNTFGLKGIALVAETATSGNASCEQNDLGPKYGSSTAHRQTLRRISSDNIVTRQTAELESELGVPTPWTLDVRTIDNDFLNLALPSLVLSPGCVGNDEGIEVPILAPPSLVLSPTYVGSDMDGIISSTLSIDLPKGPANIFEAKENEGSVLEPTNLILNPIYAGIVKVDVVSVAAPISVPKGPANIIVAEESEGSVLEPANLILSPTYAGIAKEEGVSVAAPMDLPECPADAIEARGSEASRLEPPSLILSPAHGGPANEGGNLISALTTQVAGLTDVIGAEGSVGTLLAPTFSTVSPIHAVSANESVVSYITPISPVVCSTELVSADASTGSCLQSTSPAVSPAHAVNGKDSVCMFLTPPVGVIDDGESLDDNEMPPCVSEQSTAGINTSYVSPLSTEEPLLESENDASTVCKIHPGLDSTDLSLQAIDAASRESTCAGIYLGPPPQWALHGISTVSQQAFAAESERTVALLSANKGPSAYDAVDHQDGGLEGSFAAHIWKGSAEQELPSLLSSTQENDADGTVEFPCIGMGPFARDAAECYGGNVEDNSMAYERSGSTELKLPSLFSTAQEKDLPSTHPAGVLPIELPRVLSVGSYTTSASGSTSRTSFQNPTSAHMMQLSKDGMETVHASGRFVDVEATLSKHDFDHSSKSEPEMFVDPVLVGGESLTCVPRPQGFVNARMKVGASEQVGNRTAPYEYVSASEPSTSRTNSPGFDQSSSSSNVQSLMSSGDSQVDSQVLSPTQTAQGTEGNQQEQPDARCEPDDTMNPMMQPNMGEMDGEEVSIAAREAPYVDARQDDEEYEHAQSMLAHDPYATLIQHGAVHVERQGESAAAADSQSIEVPQLPRADAESEIAEPVFTYEVQQGMVDVNRGCEVGGRTSAAAGADVQLEQIDDVQQGDDLGTAVLISLPHTSVQPENDAGARFDNLAHLSIHPDWIEGEVMQAQASRSSQVASTSAQGTGVEIADVTGEGQVAEMDGETRDDETKAEDSGSRQVVNAGASVHHDSNDGAEMVNGISRQQAVDSEEDIRDHSSEAEVGECNQDVHVSEEESEASGASPYLESGSFEHEARSPAVWEGEGVHWGGLEEDEESVTDSDLEDEDEMGMGDELVACGSIVLPDLGILLEQAELGLDDVAVVEEQSQPDLKASANFVGAPPGFEDMCQVDWGDEEEQETGEPFVNPERVTKSSSKVLMWLQTSPDKADEQGSELSLESVEGEPFLEELEPDSPDQHEK